VGRKSKPTKQTEQQPAAQAHTVVANLVIQIDGEGNPTVNHQVLVDGKPVNVHLALVTIGEFPLGVTSGDDKAVLPMRALAMGTANLAAQLHDAVLGRLMSAIDSVGAYAQTIEQKVAPMSEQPEGTPTLQKAA
jgi:hypothetical protein